VSSRRLFDRAAADGAVISEAPLGVEPAGWRFPMRNRIIAALSHVLVVVESSRQGGAMHTVNAADEIGVRVLAVPGSVRSAQSEGTNQLLKEGGAAVVTDALDVIAALELALASSGEAHLASVLSSRPPGRPVAGDADSADGLFGPEPAKRRAAGEFGELERRVLGALETTVISLTRICERVGAGVGVGPVAVALARLEELDLARPEGVGWVRL
ncbi:MAG: DNA-processing protein DprA, partial [Acidimicrobiales bacterium]